MNIIKQEQGVALVGVMMVLLILTFLGSTAFLTSTTELKISSNYDQSLRALYAAEAGLQTLLATYRQHSSYFLEKKSGQDLGFLTADPNLPKGPGSQFWLSQLRYDPGEVPSFVEVIVVGKDLGQNALSRIRATIYGALTEGSGDVPPIFKMGIVTAGTLALGGSLSLGSNLHANRGYTLEPESVVEQLKAQQFSVTQSLDPLRPDYRSSLEVPIISEKGFQEYRARAQKSGNQIFSGRQDLALTGDQQGGLIFVDGDLNLTGTDVSGLTLVATGSITLNGSINLKEGKSINSAIIAGGDIILNDFSQLSGVFWSNGAIVKIGSGRVSGALVCQGNIQQPTGLQFQMVSQISEVFLGQNSSAYSFILKGWSQL